MKISIIGGTGFLGYHTALEALNRGHEVSSVSIPDIELGDWFPEGVNVMYRDVFKMPHDELVSLFKGYDAMVYAVGPDDRVTPQAPAYQFFHNRLVEACTKVVRAAKDAGIKRCAVLNSYFAYFDRLWPERKLAERHSYIKCRIEQATSVIEAGGSDIAVMVLELPYIFGAMPERMPLWKDVLFDRVRRMKIVFFPGGGTNMIAVEKVAEAIVGTLERGQSGTRYLIGDVNMSYKDMLRIVLDTMGLKRRKIVTLPIIISKIVGWQMKRQEKKKGLESGLDYAYVFQDILSRELYFDPSESIEKLGYSQGGIKEAIEKTVRVCYPTIWMDEKEVNGGPDAI
ncbi:MAG: epimerase [Candidatus Thorarchaeota archaeon]|nr:MAG: epimerase [Candidatus Thorarchaeota archaeon]